MRVEKLHIYVALFAGIVMTVVNIFLRADLLQVCIRLIITLLVFYVAGAIAQGYVRKKVIKPKPEPEPDKQDDDEDSEPTLTDDGLEALPDEEEQV